ncbi:hypothetical protein V3510_003379 [Serratia marcescens]|uniref:hypothetical protein n=1 Tax=Serratia marcescens TaxID=615 RepID=UPI000D93E04D|nr:hypothetical protein [Serratia marcescens]EME1467121.1 hypothetical protein [Serratia marcescens]PYA07305.1 hypothetical protein DMW43_08170 [Serratia marcescens]
MKERPVIFNGEMVRAILDGRKTQTRRVMKPQPEPCYRGGHWWPSNAFKTMLHIEEQMQNGQGGWKGLAGDACPFGQVGDRLWVRETWARYNIDQDAHDMAYRATTPDDWPKEGRWRPSIHMPRWASRITLEITAVRVERLNSIGDVEAMREGIQNLTTCSHADFGIPGVVNAQHPVRAFQLLWESIYGEESWSANPWVWVIEFLRVEVK